MKVYCTSCKKAIDHRQKLGGLVCNTCDKINDRVYLERIEDGRSNSGTILSWIEFDEAGRGKAIHEDPQIGYSACLDLRATKADLTGLEDMPPIISFSWMTTQATEILEDKKSKECRTIKFKTKNSEYIVYVTKDKDHEARVERN